MALVFQNHARRRWEFCDTDASAAKIAESKIIPNHPLAIAIT
jgi:hypothetical protein